MLYTACYCEENVWHLCQEDEFSGLERQVVFISNEQRVCPIWGQRASSSDDQPVWWDYHVILLCLQDSWMVWDLDTLIGFPVAVEHYLQEAFRAPALAIPRYSPLFRVIDADEYVTIFSSDRSHMRTPSGEWLAPPPAWSAILKKDVSNFAKFVDVTSEWIGKVMSSTEFRREYGSVPKRCR